ncbi:MAG: DUF86 domain-containing protein [Candidatus Lokiarchaeota archaeon]|nr:DUF86 domain-containing protein [Candidatus Lokiarchaeota archaeon]
MDKERIKRYKEKQEYFNKVFENLIDWIKDITDDDFVYRLNLHDQFSIYHAYQILIEISADLSAMILKDIKILPKDDYVNFDELAKSNILNKDVAYHLKQANGLRNHIVHGYNGLNESIAFNEIKKYIPYFKEFREEINKWLKKN